MPVSKGKRRSLLASVVSCFARCARKSNGPSARIYIGIRERSIYTRIYRYIRIYPGRKLISGLHALASYMKSCLSLAAGIHERERERVGDPKAFGEPHSGNQRSTTAQSHSYSPSFNTFPLVHCGSCGAMRVSLLYTRRIDHWRIIEVCIYIT